MEEAVGARVITSKAENGKQLLKQLFFRKVVGKIANHTLNMKSAILCCYKKDKHHTGLCKREAWRICEARLLPCCWSTSVQTRALPSQSTV